MKIKLVIFVSVIVVCLIVLGAMIYRNYSGEKMLSKYSVNEGDISKFDLKGMIENQRLNLKLYILVYGKLNDTVNRYTLLGLNTYVKLLSSIKVEIDNKYLQKELLASLPTISAQKTLLKDRFPWFRFILIELYNSHARFSLGINLFDRKYLYLNNKMFESFDTDQLLEWLNKSFEFHLKFTN